METAQYAITDIEFEEHFKAAIDSAEEIASTQHPKNMTGVLQVITRSDFDEKLGLVLIVLADMPSDYEGRRRLFEALGAKCHQEMSKNGAPVAIIFTTEAWTKKLNKDGVDKFNKAGKKVSEYDDKTESVITAARTIDQRRAFAMHDIERYKNKKIKKLDLKLYAPYKGQSNENLFDSLLLDSFYGGMYKSLKEGRS